MVACRRSDGNRDGTRRAVAVGAMAIATKKHAQCRDDGNRNREIRPAWERWQSRPRSSCATWTSRPATPPNIDRRRPISRHYRNPRPHTDLPRPRHRAQRVKRSRRSAALARFRPMLLGAYARPFSCAAAARRQRISGGADETREISHGADGESLSRETRIDLGACFS